MQYNYSIQLRLDHVVLLWQQRVDSAVSIHCVEMVGIMPLLLSTCDDPMYPGPMKRIAYEYNRHTIQQSRWNDTGLRADFARAILGWRLGHEPPARSCPN